MITMNQINRDTSLGAALDLSNAKIQLRSGLSLLAQKAALVLVEEVEKRTRLRWLMRQEATSVPGIVIVLNQAHPTPTLPADGSQIITQIDPSSTQIQILGND